MPYLAPDVFSNYYYISMGGKRYILDSWTEITQQDELESLKGYNER
jgi:hypothetical protein